MTYDPTAAWTRAIRETGRLALVPARWPWALMAIGAAMAVLAGIGMYGDAGTNDVQRVIGVIVTIGGIIGIPMAIRTFMRGNEPIVIDTTGIQLPSRPLIPWYEVRGTNVYSSRGTHSPMIVVSPEFLERFHSGTNPLVRLFSVVNKGITRTPAIYLPTTLTANGTRVNAFALAAWLGAVAGLPANIGSR